MTECDVVLRCGVFLSSFLIFWGFKERGDVAAVAIAVAAATEARASLCVRVFPSCFLFHSSWGVIGWVFVSDYILTGEDKLTKGRRQQQDCGLLACGFAGVWVWKSWLMLLLSVCVCVFPFFSRTAALFYLPIHRSSSFHPLPPPPRPSSYLSLLSLFTPLLRTVMYVCLPFPLFYCRIAFFFLLLPSFLDS